MAEKYPFKLLDSFEATDKAIFFGRTDEVAELYKMVFQSNILTVYGASGTGKTSLIRCGLAGEFKPYDWFAIYVRRGTNINDSLNNAIIAAGGAAGTSDLAAALKDIYLDKFRPIYFIFDQFEELYTYTAGNDEKKTTTKEDTAKEEQKKFIATIKEILTIEQPVKLIFSIREDYVGHLYDFEKEVPQLMRKKLRVEPMTEAQVSKVILGTIKQTNVINIEAGEKPDEIATAIFEKVRGEDKTLTIQLPTLQVFLYKLYNSTKNEDGLAKFSLAAVNNMPEIADILRQFLEEQVKDTSTTLSKGSTKVTEEHIWAVLSPLATLDGTKQPITEAGLVNKITDVPKKISVETVRNIIEAFVKARILRESEGVYELAHDSLASKIAARRSNAEVELLEIKDMIATHIKQKDREQRLFTEKQVQRIDLIKEKFTPEGEGLALYNESKKEVRNKKRIKTVLITILVNILFAFSAKMYLLYEQANEARKTATSLQQEATSALNKLELQTAMNKAKEEAAYGASYKDNGDTLYANESYRNAIDTLNSFIKRNEDTSLNASADSFIKVLQKELNTPQER